MRTGVLAGVLAALCLAVPACSTPPSERDGPLAPRPVPRAAVTAAIDPGSVPPCPRWDEPPDYPDGPLPPGAVSLRICAGDDSVLHPPRFWAGIAAPSDALTTDVSSIVEHVNGLPAFALGPGEYCTQEGRPRIKYVFGYLDGSTATITHGYGECHVLELEEPGDLVADARGKEGAPAFGAVVAQALLDQRESLRPPRDVAAAPGCVPNIAPRSVLPVSELDLATAALCLLPDGRRYRRVDLGPALVARVGDVLHGEREASVEECDELPFAKLVGTSTWGDPMELAVTHCAIELWGDNWTNAPDYVPLGPDLVTDLLAQPRGPWIKQR